MCYEYNYVQKYVPVTKTGIKYETCGIVLRERAEGNFSFFFRPHCMACGILVPQPEIDPGSSAVKVLSPNHWTAREFPEGNYFYA